ncbi:hypothetical protein, partial [Enterobacter hormaechei]|uniref:hypothetical protein n=1 Tax=Enterobacter hormaechei TaxID=158836 RepID=UPI00197EE206
MLVRVLKSGKPWYKGAELSESFKSFYTFYKFITSLKGYDEFMNGGWALDSDLMLGYKSYTEEGICFVPEAVNTFLTHDRKKGKFDGLPIGV